MKTIKTAITLAALVSTCWTAGAISITNGPINNPANGHSYYLLSPATWGNAETFAQTLGGHLVTINDAAENTWINQNFMVTHPTLNPFFGLTDDGHFGTWTWISGEPVTYLNWGPGEPNFSFEHFGNLFEQTSPYPGAWNNTSDALLYSIAEDVPEPSALSLGMLAIGLAIARRRRP